MDNKFDRFAKLPFNMRAKRIQQCRAHLRAARRFDKVSTQRTGAEDECENDGAKHGRALPYIPINWHPGTVVALLKPLRKVPLFTSH